MEPCVITRLKGGLGNQMFQYAAGYALAERLGVPLLVDRSALDARPAGMDWTPRALELDVFQCPVRIAGEDGAGGPGGSGNIVRRTIGRIAGAGRRHYMERSTAFDPALFDQRAPVLIEGYWQDERYFAPHARALRERLFVPHDPPSEANLALRDAIGATVSASLHVRRGDYADNAPTRAHHGLLDPAYHREAARWLAAEKGALHFFVFTDDPEWVRGHLDLGLPHTVAAHNSGRESHWDLWLMKQCRHHIIANSSFSWWGAWLNDRNDKTVIAPRKWFASAQAPDLPTGWIAR